MGNYHAESMLEAVGFGRYGAEFFLILQNCRGRSFEANIFLLRACAKKKTKKSKRITTRETSF